MMRLNKCTQVTAEAMAVSGIYALGVHFELRRFQQVENLVHQGRVTWTQSVTFIKAALHMHKSPGASSIVSETGNGPSP